MTRPREADQSEQLKGLAREIRRLEDAVAANPSAELVRELDRIRVEYRFQLQLNDRARTRSLNVPYVRTSDVVRKKASIWVVLYFKFHSYFLTLSFDYQGGWDAVKGG